MSQAVTTEKSCQDDNDGVRSAVKCRIPQRCPQARTKFYNKPKKYVNPSEPLKSKFEPSAPQVRLGGKNTPRPHSVERRPLSASHEKNELVKVTAHSAKGERDRMMPAAKKPPTFQKRMTVDSLRNKTAPSITVPINRENKKREEYDEKTSLQTDVNNSLTTNFTEESLTSQAEIITHLKNGWEEKVIQFQKMKIDLSYKQKEILELYATMKVTREKMAILGQAVTLPAADELRMMNISKLSPEQLLTLCARENVNQIHQNKQDEGQTGTFSIDMNKLYNIPANLVTTCEETLTKHKEIIIWLDSLITSKSKGIKMNNLIDKINDFNAENEMLNNLLNKVKTEFIGEIQEITEFIRKGVDEAMGMQLRAEQLTYTISDLNSQNTDLRRQLQKAEHFKSYNNKARIEELEREVKEEKCAKTILRDRNSRAEGQIKIQVERVAQLESALEQARSQSRTLERTVQHLHEENQKLQINFDKELNKLTESIKENTRHLSEIAETREKLQSEKEELEKRLEELSQYYNEAMENMKNEVNSNIGKLVEADKKFHTEMEEKKNLEKKVESLCGQLLDAELRNKDLTRDIKEKENDLELANKYLIELEVTKASLQNAQLEIGNYTTKLQQQSDALEQNESSVMEIIESREHLKVELNIKEEYISELENKQTLLEQQISESEQKMEAYEEQMTMLKNKLKELQHEFGELENFNNLRQKVKEQEAKLKETTRVNIELTETLQSKLEQKDMRINMLTEKEKEQLNIIKLLQNNLEIRTQADSDLTNQLSQKENAIDTLSNNLETRKKEVSHLEKIILTLEEQTHVANQQRKKDQQLISVLEKKIAQYESLPVKSKRSNPDDIDNIIEMFESELNLEPHLFPSRHTGKKMNKYIKEHPKKEKIENFESHERNSSGYRTQHDNMPTKIVMGNYAKKTYIPNKDDLYLNDNVGRKKPHTNMDTLTWLPAISSGPQVNNSIEQTAFRDHINVCNEQVSTPYFVTNHQNRNEKKYKMFKLAGHKL